MNDPKQKTQLLDALDKDALDAEAPVGKSDMTILMDMENLDQERDQYLQDLKGGLERE